MRHFSLAISVPITLHLNLAHSVSDNVAMASVPSHIDLPDAQWTRLRSLYTLTMSAQLRQGCGESTVLRQESHLVTFPSLSLNLTDWLTNADVNTAFTCSHLATQDAKD